MIHASFRARYASAFRIIVLTATVLCPGIALAQSPPGPVSNPWPSDEKTVSNTEFVLSWDPATGADDYYVFLSTDVSPLYVGTTTGTTWNSGILDDETSYYWKIIAHNVDGNSSAVVWDFHVSVPQKLMWAKRAGSVNSIYTYDGKAAATEDGVVITGYFQGTIEFDKNGPNETSLVAIGSNDIFMAKYAPNGEFEWARKIGSATSDYIRHIGAFPDGGAVVSGWCGTGAVFGEGEPNETTHPGMASYNFFIARYYPDGVFQWMKYAGHSGTVYAEGVAACPDGSSFAAGYYLDNITFGEYEPNETMLEISVEGVRDMYVAKFNPDGTLAWAKRAGAESTNDYLYNVAAFQHGSCVIAGRFYDNAGFGVGEPNETWLYDGTGNTNIFVARYNPDGTLAWARQDGSGPSEYPYGLAVSPDNCTIMAGYFYYSAIFGEGEANQTTLTVSGDGTKADVFLAKYTPSGTLAWAVSAGGNAGDYARSASCASDGSIYVSGYYDELSTFGKTEGNETTLFSDAGSYDVFYAKYNPDGTFAWVVRGGGSGIDYGYGITACSNSSVYMVGRHNTGATFGAGEDLEETLASDGGYDLFVARYGAAPPAADFTADVTSGTVPLSVNFSDLSNGSFSSWQWEFGCSGEIDSNQQNPGYTYEVPGNYTVTLQVDGAGGASSREKKHYINAQPVAVPYEVNYIRPYNGSTIKSHECELKWDIAPGAEWYYVYMSDSYPPAYDGCTSNTSYQTGLLNDETTYYWKVMAHNSYGNSTEGPIWQFRLSVPYKLAWAERSFSGAWVGSQCVQCLENSIWTAGEFDISVTFGQGEDNETTLNSVMHEDIFVTRHNQSGELAWAKRAGNMEGDFTCGLFALPDKSMLVTGYFLGNAVFGPGEPNETFLQCTGDLDGYLAKYNPDGTLEWVKHFRGPGYELGCAVCAMSDGSILVTGAYGYNAVFGFGETNETTLEATGYYDFFIAKFNSMGELSWISTAKSYGQISGGGAIGLLSDQTIVVTGTMFGYVTFGEGEPSEDTVCTDSPWDCDVFLARYDQSGNFLGIKTAGGRYVDSGGRKIGILSDDSIIVAGKFKDYAVFGQGEANVTTLHAENMDNENIFIARYDSAGSLLWAKSVGNNFKHSAYSTEVFPDDSFVVTGYTGGGAVFGRGEANETRLGPLAAGDGYDHFLAKYSPGGSLQWVKRDVVSGTGLKYFRGVDVAILSGGAIIVTGNIYGDVTFAPGEDNQTSFSASATSFFLARYGSGIQDDPPGPPIGLLASGRVNPTSLGDNAVFFSAVYSDSGDASPADSALIQVDENAAFTSIYWDSGWIAISPVGNNSRCLNIPYTGGYLTPGTQYYWRIKFRNQLGQAGEWSVTSDNFTVASFTQVLGFKGYHLINIPCITGGMTVGELFGDDLSMIWAYRYEESTRTWIQLNAADTLDNESGYFFWCDSPVEVAGLNAFGGVFDDGGNRVISLSLGNEDDLNNYGWNLIRNPFCQEVSWSACTLQNCDLTHYRPWTGTEYEWYLDGGNHSPGGTDAIPGGAAFWAHANGSDAEITIPDPGPPPAPKPLLSPPPFWRIPIAVRTGQYTDTSTYISVRDGALAGRDSYDVMEISSFTQDYIQAFFEHEDWDCFSGNYTQDTRPFPPVGCSAAWRMIVHATDSDGEVTLSWDVPEELLAGWRFYLRDEAGGALKDMTLWSTYQYSAGSVDTRAFTLTASRLPGLVFGDANLDGKMTAEDAAFCARAEHELESLSPQQRYVSDINSDGAINVCDSLLILRRIRGHLPPGP